MRISLLIWMSLLLPSVVAEGRTWTDITGTHRLDAQLVNLAAGKVRLQATDGRTYSIALDQLSLADRKVVLDQDRNLQDIAEAGVPQALTVALRSAPSDGPSTRQIPAPLPLDTQPSSGQVPLIPSAPLSGQAPMPLPGLPAEPTTESGGQVQTPAGGQQPTDPGKDKRIFSGCRSSFHLASRDGTGAYWVDDKHYLAKLTWFRTDGNYVYFTGTGEGGVQAWAFFDIESCGGNRVYAWMSGGKSWRVFDHDSRELPN